ncbi:jg1566 [Pararge aegeria aegeria]|uniref:Jg1566 protein n=1 Tax=Pararge aegeria aegeria TaxID=348720 RepID=A0A8S4RCZ2_9NEOP|nr:jg1566 [Pararge aegeria aegeria]
MWNVESTVVVSVNGLLAKSVDQHLKKLSLGCWIKGSDTELTHSRAHSRALTAGVRCSTRGLRDYNGERAAESSVLLLLLSTVITSPSALCGLWANPS